MRTVFGSELARQARKLDALLDAALDVDAAFREFGVEGYYDADEREDLEARRARALEGLAVAINHFAGERRTS